MTHHHTPIRTHHYLLPYPSITSAIMPRTALFVIDIQHSLAADPATEIPHASRLRAAATTVLTRARAAIDASRSRGQEPGLEIVVVQHEEPPEKGPLVKETQAWGLVFPPREGDVLECLVGKRDRAYPALTTF